MLAVIVKLSLAKSAYIYIYLVTTANTMRFAADREVVVIPSRSLSLSLYEDSVGIIENPFQLCRGDRRRTQ
jgi:hypothetical protein